jgi:hypothetical protein
MDSIVRDWFWFCLPLIVLFLRRAAPSSSVSNLLSLPLHTKLEESSLMICTGCLFLQSSTMPMSTVACQRALLPANVHCCLPTSTAACQRPLLPAGARCCLLMSPTPAIACWKNRRDGGGAPCLELSGDGVAVAGEVPRHSWVQPVTNIANINVIYSDFSQIVKSLWSRDAY